MIGIDTNVLLRILLQDDPEQSDRAVRLIKSRTAQEAVLINPIVLAEAVWTIRRKLGGGRNDIAPQIEQLLDTQGFEVMYAEAARRALDVYRAGKADFADYLVAEINAEIGCRTTFTFDKEAVKGPKYSPVP
jgi:predicted nucleic-acid-binding protein